MKYKLKFFLKINDKFCLFGLLFFLWLIRYNKRIELLFYMIMLMFFILFYKLIFNVYNKIFYFVIFDVYIFIFK